MVTRRCMATRRAFWWRREMRSTPDRSSPFRGRLADPALRISISRFAETGDRSIPAQFRSRSPDMASISVVRDNSPRPAGKEAALSVIAPGTKITGELTSDGVVKVEGLVIGTVRAERQVLVVN